MRSFARWPCSTGKSLGRKQVEGDQKTPEGIYFVTREVSGRFLSKTYGTRALPLDYPNWSDRRNHRSGSAIWLHGTNKRLEPLDSNGCIVFENRVIDALSRRIKVRSTPVILVDRLRWQSQRGAVLKSREILPILYRWQQALMGGSYSKFKRWYTPSAAPTMAWWHRWCRLRNQSVPEPGAYHSVVANEMVLQYKNSLIIVFDHYLRHGKKKIWCGRRKMYLKHEGHRVRIAGEEYIEDALGQKSTTTDDPLFYTWRQITSFEYSLMAPAGKDCPTIKQSAWNLRRGL